jgi:hypothetical protein
MPSKINGYGGEMKVLLMQPNFQLLGKRSWKLIPYGLCLLKACRRILARPGTPKGDGAQRLQPDHPVHRKR